MPPKSFPPSKRLDQSGVRAVLQGGRRVSRADVEIKFVVCPYEGHGARLAIAVAKRLVKHAVARNQIKRVVREGFRQHAVSSSGQDLLVTYKSKNTIQLPASRAALRIQLDQLFSEVLRKALATPKPGLAA